MADSVRFGDLVLDTKGRRVLRDGNRIALGPMEFKLFETLVRNHDRVLTGDELRILVWSDDPSRREVPAGDVNALYVSIRKLRAALGESGKWIVNIPKVGYTISGDAEIEELNPATAELPQDATPFVGRETELETLRGSLQHSRLVTLTGSPGVGKTRLAKEAVRTLSESFSEGIHFIDLTSVTEPEYVARAVLSTFDLPDSHESELRDSLANFFKDKSAVLVFDNCEHLIESASKVIEILNNVGRNVRVLATSREPLLLPNETVVMVGPLATPPLGEPITSANLMQFDATRLFIELAKQRRADLNFVDSDIPFIQSTLARYRDGADLAR